MAVATQTTERPDIRITPDDFRATPRIRFGRASAVVAKPTTEADVAIWCMSRYGRHMATLLIEGTDVWVRTVGVIHKDEIADIAGLADLIEGRAGEILEAKRESIHAN